MDSEGKRPREEEGIERRGKRRLIKCSKCERNFTSESSLADHFLVSHMEEETSDHLPLTSSRGKGSKEPGCHECKICHRTYSYAHGLRKHARTHEGEFRCRKCRWGFKTPELLAEHEATHKMFECRWCSRCFMTSSGHKAHERTHTGERPYACADCPKSYNYQGGLDYHLKANPTHRAQEREEEEPTPRPPAPKKSYDCADCPKKYKSLDGLKYHLRVNPTHRAPSKEVEPERVVSPSGGPNHVPKGERRRELSGCVFPNCNAKFPSDELLNRHIRMVHKTKGNDGGVIVADSEDDSEDEQGRQFESEDDSDDEEEKPEESGVLLCMLCCFSFYRDDEALPENLSRTCQFEQFVCEGLRGDGDVEEKSCSDLFSPFRNLSVCQDCRDLINMAMRQRQAVIETGKKVRRKEVEPRALWVGLADYAVEMRRIAEVVAGGDVQCLELHLERAEKKLRGEGGKCWVRLLRDKIGPHASKLEESSKKLRLKGSIPPHGGKGKTTLRGDGLQVKSEVDDGNVVTID